MSEQAAAEEAWSRRGLADRGTAEARATGTWQPPDVRRWLQLALGVIWLLDAELQYQAFMFTKSFGQMLAATAQGNPAVIAEPITWSADHRGPSRPG